MKRTSLVFECWEQLFAALDGVGWPSHPTTGLLPTISLALPQETFDESVVVPGRSQDDNARQVWITSGRPSKEERFTLDVLIITQVPGRSATEAKNRLKALTAVVESTLRNSTSGLPQGILLGPADGLVQWGVAEIVPAVGALDVEGFGGSCRIGVDFLTRL